MLESRKRLSPAASACARAANASGFRLEELPAAAEASRRNGARSAALRPGTAQDGRIYITKFLVKKTEESKAVAARRFLRLHFGAARRIVLWVLAHRFKQEKNRRALRRTDQRRTVDERETEYPRDVRQLSVWRQGDARAPAQGDLQEPEAQHGHGRGAGARGGRRDGDRHEGMGDRDGRDALHPLVPAADRHHRRKARLLHQSAGRRHRHHGAERQGAHQGRARRVVLPVRRHPRDV